MLPVLLFLTLRKKNFNFTFLFCYGKHIFVASNVASKTVFKLICLNILSYYKYFIYNLRYNARSQLEWLEFFLMYVIKTHIWTAASLNKRDLTMLLKIESIFVSSIMSPLIFSVIWHKNYFISEVPLKLKIFYF